MVNHPSVLKSRVKWILFVCLGKVLTILYSYTSPVLGCMWLLLNQKLKNSYHRKLIYIADFHGVDGKCCFLNLFSNVHRRLFSQELSVIPNI